MVMTRPPSPRRAKPTDTLDPGGGSETCRGWNRSEGESASTDAVPFSPETVNSHAGKRMVPCAVSQMSVPRCTRRTLSGGPAYLPCTGGVGVARRWNACCAEMMTQRPSRAGDEGNLVGGVIRPKPKAIFASPLTKPAPLNWTVGATRLGELEPSTPAHALFAAASSCLSREERLAVLG